MLGIILTTRILETAMTRHPQGTYLIILGFMLGSVPELFPGLPSGLDWLFCPLMLAAGFVVIWLISRLEEKSGGGEHPGEGRKPSCGQQQVGQGEDRGPGQDIVEIPGEEAARRPWQAGEHQTAEPVQGRGEKDESQRNGVIP